MDVHWKQVAHNCIALLLAASFSLDLLCSATIQGQTNQIFITKTVFLEHNAVDCARKILALHTLAAVYLVRLKENLVSHE